MLPGGKQAKEVLLVRRVIDQPLAEGFDGATNRDPYADERVRTSFQWIKSSVFLADN